MQKQLWKKIDLILTIQPNVIDDATRVVLVTKGPVRITEYDFPKMKLETIVVLRKHVIKKTQEWRRSRENVANLFKK